MGRTPVLRPHELFPRSIDGREVHDRALGRLRRRVDSVLMFRSERDELELERRLHSLPGVTRPNLIAVISPRGGVGKSAAAFLVGNLLASHLKLRTVIAGPGPVGHGVPLDDLERVATAAELRRHVSILPTGLHVLGAADLTPERCGRLIALLSCFYDAVLLDVGSGVTKPLARLAIERADQLVLATTPDRLTATIVLHALDQLPRAETTTVLVNKAHRNPAGEARHVEECFRRRSPHRTVTLPVDRRLGTMLGTGTYALGALDPPTRIAVKRLGLAVSERLV